MKPVQTGISAESDEESDVESVARLADPPRARTLVSYPDPLAPAVAARVAGLPALELDDVVEAVRADLVDFDLVLVEGAGGLLVPMGADGWTVADLASALGAPAVVVARAGLGTLNHTALTLEACARREIDAMVVIGAWPAAPGLVHWTNRVELPGSLAGALPGALPGALAGALPEAAGALNRDVFHASAPSWLAADLYGTFDPAAFTR